MRESIRIERQIRLENFLDKIEATTPPPHLIRRRIKTLIELYLGHLRVEDPEWPNSKVSAKEILLSSANGYAHMYVHIPVQRRAAEALQALKTDNLELVEKLLKKMMSEEGGKAIQSEIQTIHRSKRGKNNKFHNLIDELFKKEPAMNDNRLLQLLKREVGREVIRSIDERNNKIYIQGGGEFAITGLKDHLSKRRKQL